MVDVISFVYTEMSNNKTVMLCYSGRIGTIYSNIFAIHLNLIPILATRFMKVKVDLFSSKLKAVQY